MNLIDAVIPDEDGQVAGLEIGDSGEAAEPMRFELLPSRATTPHRATPKQHAAPLDA